MSNTLEIKFDGNSSGIYRPWNIVCVSLELTVEKAIEGAISLRMEADGVEKVFWDDTNHLQSIMFDGSNTLFFESGFIFGGTPNSRPKDINVGVKNYRFTFRVPKEMPSTFEGINGRIEYEIRAYLEVAEDSISKSLSCVKKFVVFRFEDFMDYTNLKTPIAVEGKIGYGRVLQKFLRVRISTIREGFCNSDEVPIKINIRNSSDQIFPSSLLTFCRVEKVNAQNPFNKVNVLIKILNKVPCEGIMAFSNRNFTELLHVPKNSPSTNDHLCELFQISYRIIFTVYPRPDKSKKAKPVDNELPPALVVQMPIYVGAVAVNLDDTDNPLDINSTPCDDAEFRE